MLTKEQIEEMRKKHSAIAGNGTYFYVYFYKKFPLLLDELEAETARADEWEDEYKKAVIQFDMMEADRDHWKAESYKWERDYNHWKRLCEMEAARADDEEHDRMEVGKLYEKLKKDQFDNADCNICPLRTWEGCDEICKNRLAMAQWLATIAEDRDRQEKHVEALERAFKSCNYLHASCEVCVHGGTGGRLCEECNDDYNNWIFDYKRFTKEG